MKMAAVLPLPQGEAWGEGVFSYQEKVCSMLDEATKKTSYITQIIGNFLLTGYPKRDIFITGI